MLVILARRLAQAGLVLLLVALISFAIFRFVGSPVENILGQEATVADRNELIERMGLADPIPVQYARFVWKALNFDFGISYRTAEPVADLIASRLPATLELAFISALMALAAGILLGIFTAINRGGFLAGFVMTTSLIGVSLPTFLIGVLLIWLFSVELGWLPSFGRGETVKRGFWETGRTSEPRPPRPSGAWAAPPRPRRPASEAHGRLSATYRKLRLHFQPCA